MRRVHGEERIGCPFTNNESRSGGAEDEPDELGVEEEDGRGDDPGDDGGEPRIGEFAHLGAVARKLDQRDHREGQLKAENHLAENKQRGDFVLAGETNNQGGRNDGDGAGDEPAKPGLEPKVEKTFHDNLAGQGAGERGVLAGGEQRTSEERAGEAGPEDGAEELVGVSDFGDVVKAAGVESRGAKNENRGIDKKRKAKGERGIEDGISHGFPPITHGGAECASLNDAGVQIQIVRHDGGAQDADGDVEHFAVAKDLRTRDEADGCFAPKGVSEKDFVSETNGDRTDKRDDESFDQAEAPPLQRQNDENVECGDKNAGQKRQAKEKFQRHRRAENLGKIAGGNGDFADYPKKQTGGARIVLAAGLGQVTSGSNSELRRERLQKHGHQVADEDDAEKRVAEFRAATDVRGPISGVHVADGDKIARAGKGQNFADPRSAGRKRDGAIRFRQGRQEEPRGRLRGREKTGGSFTENGGFSFEW